MKIYLTLLATNYKFKPKQLLSKIMTILIPNADKSVVKLYSYTLLEILQIDAILLRSNLEIRNRTLSSRSHFSDFNLRI